jgi:Tol biopolymer transport system component
MTPRYNHEIALLLLAAVLSACGGDSTAPPTTGTLDFNVVTTGPDIDVDGFLLRIDDESPEVPIPANGKLSITKLPGTHTLALSGLSINCDVTTAPASAEVILGTTTRVDVRASCTTHLSNVIIFTSEEFGFGEVMVMRPDGSRRERLTTDQSTYAAPVVSPDGQSIAVASFRGGSWNGIYLLDRFGKGRTTLVSHSTFDGSPVWSPDGTKIAFRSNLSGPYGDYGRIFIVNRDGTGLRQLTPEVAAGEGYQYDDGPSWSRDGTRLVFTRNGMLSLINADGTGLISTGVLGTYPAWSPDGTQIAYGGVLGNGTDGIFVMDMSFSSRRLTAAGPQDGTPRWSGDGHQLVFQRAGGPTLQIYRIDVDGSGETKLSTVTQAESWPSWSRSF